MSGLPPGYVLRPDGTAYNPAHRGAGPVYTPPTVHELLAAGLPDPAPPPAHDLPAVVEFVVPGRCQAGQRVDGGRRVPAETREFKARVHAYAALAMRGLEPFTGPVRLSLTFYLARGPNTPPGLTLPIHQSCGDLSNFVKAAEDGCNRVVWIDDRQVAVLVASKLFCVLPDEGEVSVRVEAL